MLKIVEIHPATSAQGEYVVLQNQGLLTVSLRGWALCTDAYLSGDAALVAQEMYIFREDVPIKPYTCVVLFTGSGQDGWVPTVDGRQAYCAYWGRRERIWTHSENIHILHLASTRRVAAPVSESVPVPA